MPLSINDNGDVVGYYNPYNSYGYSMFIYHNGVASASIKGYSSGTFPYPSALSMVINDAGQILINGSLYTYTVTASNTDYSSMNLPGVTGLSVWQGWAKVTNGQFAGLASLSTSTYSSGATIYAATAGTYDLSTKQVTGLFNLSAAQTSAAVTLGANAAGETLTGGAGTTTFSVAFANDTLNGGSGTNIFDYAWQPTSVAGAVINGGTGTNILNTWDADLSVLTINNVQTLNASQSWVTMTAAQFAGFTKLNAIGSTITINTGLSGTYDLTSKTVTGLFNLNATGATGVITLNGNAAGETLTGGYGWNTLSSGAGAEILNGGTGTNNFNIAWRPTSIAGTVINGVTGAVNIINTWDADLSVLTINNVQTLNASQSWVTMSAAQFAGFTKLNAIGATITINTGLSGTYDLTSKTVTGLFNLNAAGATGVITLTGNAAGETLTAGYGWNTLSSGAGAEILNGGTGTNNFNIAWRPTSIAGTVINGGTGGTNIINTWDGDLSVLTINNVPTLNANQSWVRMTASQFAGFTKLNAPVGVMDLQVTNAGTYNLATKTVTGSFNLDAGGTSANITLIGNNQAAQVLTGGAGVDVLQAGNGAGDVLTAGTGATTLTAGTGNDILNAGLVGNDVLNGNTGVETYAFGSTFGQDTINNIANGTRTVAAGSISFGAGVTDEKLWFQRSGNNLIVDLLGTTDTVTVQNWYGTNAGAQVSSFIDSTDSLKLDTQFAALVQAMATYSGAHSGFNPQTSGTVMPTDTALQTAITTAWHH